MIDLDAFCQHIRARRLLLVAQGESYDTLGLRIVGMGPVPEEIIQGLKQHQNIVYHYAKHHIAALCISPETHVHTYVRYFHMVFGCPVQMCPQCAELRQAYQAELSALPLTGTIDFRKPFAHLTDSGKLKSIKTLHN